MTIRPEKWNELKEQAIKILQRELERIVQIETYICDATHRFPVVRLPDRFCVIIRPRYSDPPENMHPAGELLQRGYGSFEIIVKKNSRIIATEKAYTAYVLKVFPPFIVDLSRKLPAKLLYYINEVKRFRRWLEKVHEKLEAHWENIWAQPQHQAAAREILEEAALMDISKGGE